MFRIISLLLLLLAGPAQAQNSEQLQINSLSVTIAQLVAQNAKLGAELQLAQKQIEAAKPKPAPLPKEKPNAK